MHQIFTSVGRSVESAENPASIAEGRVYSGGHGIIGYTVGGGHQFRSGDMDGRCSQCGVVNVEPAHFCAQCGGPLDASPGTVGRAPHPNPIAVPGDYRCCRQAVDLYFCDESAWGGPRLLGTETLGLLLFNTGYALKHGVLKIDGVDESGKALYSVNHPIEHLPRGIETKIEIPSYEISEPATDLVVTLVSAEYDG